MTAATKEKRLDTMELQLTPKEWAIRLAHEMRSQPSEADFISVVADKPYRKWPWVKPFFRLCEQAEARHPGNKPENIHARNQSARRLRTEFHALKKLICKANEIIRSKAETVRLKTGLKLSTLHRLILQDAIGRTARKTADWTKSRKTTGAEADEERQLILKELAGYTELGLSLGPTCPLLIEDWIDELTMLLMDVYAHKAVVRAIQEKYFDGHPILFCDTEGKLAETIRSLEDAVSMFDEYLATRDALFNSESDPEDRADAAESAMFGEREGHLAIDIEGIRGRLGSFLVDHITNEWVKESKAEATADILQETGEHEAHVWQTFRDRVQK
jgi:hypothetical protein